MDDVVRSQNERFLAKYSDTDGHDVPVYVPWRLSFTAVECNASAVRACSMEWILRYLDEGKCPHPLTEYICASSLASLAQMDLTNFRATSADAELTTEILDGMKVCQIALTTCRKTCHEYAVGQLPMPAFEDSRWLWSTDVDAIRNRRRKMEDRHIVLPYLEKLSDSAVPQTSLYAVFDGHRGADAAEFAASFLPTTLLSNPNFESDLPLAIKEAVKEVDNKFLQYADPKSIRAGCTALVVCLRNATVYAAWLGDSQLMVCRQEQADLVTPPHSAEREDEQERIDSLGGIVIQASGSWRVSGQLAVSRAIGDSDLKKYLTSDVDQVQFEVDTDHDFLVLACDGVWDAKNITVDAMREAVAKTRNDQGKFDGPAKALVDLSRTGSDDNITAIVVDLKGYCAASS